jgi:hypothetical protein
VKVLAIMLANEHPNSTDLYTLQLLKGKEGIADDVLDLPSDELALTVPTTGATVNALSALLGAEGRHAA